MKTKLYVTTSFCAEFTGVIADPCSVRLNGDVNDKAMFTDFNSPELVDTSLENGLVENKT